MTNLYKDQRSPPAELMGSRFVSFDKDKGELSDKSGNLLARATSTAMPTPVPGMEPQ